MFPSTPESEIKHAVEGCNSLEEAAHILADSPSVTQHENSAVMKPKSTLDELLLELKSNMCSGEERKKLKVDEDDLLSDALTFYKRRDFDPKYPIRIIYEGQPAADTGGVLRQFYSDLLQQLAEKFSLV